MKLLGRIARDTLEAAIVALLLGLLVRTFVVQVYQVPSASMEPVLRAGDYLLVNKMQVRSGRGWPNPWLPQRAVARGDVLVFPHPREAGRLLVKRCLAGSGERVHIEDKALFIARERLDEPYAVFRDDRVYPASSFLPEEIRVRDQFGPMVVAEGGLLCLGDNRDHSLDSRHWGTVERRRVVGQAVLALRFPSQADSLAESQTASQIGESQAEESWRLFRVR